MFDVVVVSILKLAEDGFHKLDDGYGILCASSVFDVGEDFLLLVVDPSPHSALLQLQSLLIVSLILLFN